MEAFRQNDKTNEIDWIVGVDGNREKNDDYNPDRSAAMTKSIVINPARIHKLTPL